MGQYQTRAAKTTDEVEDQGERDSGVESEGSRIPVPCSQEVTPPLAPVFGSPIDSKLQIFQPLVKFMRVYTHTNCTTSYT